MKPARRSAASLKRKTQAANIHASSQPAQIDQAAPAENPYAEFRARHDDYPMASVVGRAFDANYAATVITDLLRTDTDAHCAGSSADFAPLGLFIVGGLQAALATCNHNLAHALESIEESFREMHAMSSIESSDPCTGRRHADRGQ